MFSPNGAPRTVGSATGPDFYGEDEAACFGRDRRRGRRWWDLTRRTRAGNTPYGKFAASVNFTR